MEQGGFPFSKKREVTYMCCLIWNIFQDFSDIHLGPKKLTKLRRIINNFIVSSNGSVLSTNFHVFAKLEINQFERFFRISVILISDPEITRLGLCEGSMSSGLQRQS